MFLFVSYFFFSSRRRHTRCLSDWSSDVCSSDLAGPPNGFVQAADGTLPGVPTVEDTLVPTDKNNFAPRAGFAYRLNNSGSLVARGGHGIYYDRFSTRYANTQLLNYPYLALAVGLPGILRTMSDPFIPVPQPGQFPVNPTIPSPLSP